MPQNAHKQTSNNKKANASNSVRTALVLFLTQNHKNGVLNRGITKEAANKFPIFGERQIRRIWRNARPSVLDSSIVPDYFTRKTGNSGRKPKYTEDEGAARIRSVPLHKRQNLRSLATSTGVPRSTLWRILKRGWMRRHSSALKPLLTETNKLARVNFALSFVQPNKKFNPMYEFVHIDEKWFYITKQNTGYYLVPGEPDPIRTCKSKRFVTKVMFMAAVARPRYDHHRKGMFDGKIGIWPFTFQDVAQRNSRNRPAGTLVTKVVPNINREEIRKMFSENIIPAIKSKWPRGTKKVIIQQDNAGPHTKEGDLDVAAICRDDTFDIQVTCQPPNSPDFNVLDLGFFNAIQSLQHQNYPKTIDDLIACTEKAFADMEVHKLDDIFLSLQQCMEQSMLVRGGNNYKVPHMGKQKMRNNGTLPVSIRCSDEALMVAQATINGDEIPQVNGMMNSQGDATLDSFDLELDGEIGALDAPLSDIDLAILTSDMENFGLTSSLLPLELYHDGDDLGEFVLV